MSASDNNDLKTQELNEQDDFANRLFATPMGMMHHTSGRDSYEVRLRMAHPTSGRNGNEVVPPELKPDASAQFQQQHEEQNEAYQKQLAARLEKKKAAAGQKDGSSTQ